MSARRVTFSALRSSLDSFGPPSSLRRLRASAVVIGAGATGPRLRAASLRLGVGLPLGAVVRRSWSAPWSLDSSTESDVLGLRVVLLTAQQIHACQVTSACRRRPGAGRRPACIRRAETYPAQMTGPALHVLIAPDCFGDSLTAVEAAEAIAAGWRRGRAATTADPGAAVRRRARLRRRAGQPARRAAHVAGSAARWPTT